jgi:hypothetical protein
MGSEIISMRLENQVLEVRISLLLEVEARGPRFGVLPQLYEQLRKKGALNFGPIL